MGISAKITHLYTYATKNVNNPTNIVDIHMLSSDRQMAAEEFFVEARKYAVVAQTETTCEQQHT